MGKYTYNDDEYDINKILKYKKEFLEEEPILNLSRLGIISP